MTVADPLGMAEQEQTQGLQEVVNVARAAVEQEFQISERLDAKARGLVTLAGQWFAVVQAVSAVAFAFKGANVLLLYGVGVAALVGGGLLAWAFGRSYGVWKIRDEPAVHPQGILDLKARAEAAGAEALEVTTRHYASMLQDRRRTNKDRWEALEKAQAVWVWAMAIPLTQLALALAARLFG